MPALSPEPLEIAPAPEAAFAPKPEATVAFLLSLRAKGVFDLGVLRAMETVPRDLFAPRRFADLSRRDVALPLPCGQTMSAPMTIATMLVALGLEKGARILEIGTGSGYVTALLAQWGDVHSVERYRTLAHAAIQRINAMECKNARVEIGDGLSDVVAARAYDRILINGALSYLPASLLGLLAPGGRLVGAIGQPKQWPRLIKVQRDANGQFPQSLGSIVRLNPLAPHVARAL